MKYSQRLFRKQFTSEESSKDAYMELCKWLAKNVISKKDEIGEMTFEINKVKADYPTFELTLYAMLDENDVNKLHCDACKEAHRLFYVGNEAKCDSCAVNAYRTRMKQRLNTKSQYTKSIILRKIGDI